MPKCRITVLKKIAADQNLVDEYLDDSLKEKGFGACTVFEDEQEFVMDSPRMPEGFCN